MEQPPVNRKRSDQIYIPRENRSVQSDRFVVRRVFLPSMVGVKYQARDRLSSRRPESSSLDSLVVRWTEETNVYIVRSIQWCFRKSRSNLENRSHGWNIHPTAPRRYGKLHCPSRLAHFDLTNDRLLNLAVLLYWTAPASVDRTIDLNRKQLLNVEERRAVNLRVRVTNGTPVERPKKHWFLARLQPVKDERDSWGSETRAVLSSANTKVELLNRRKSWNFFFVWLVSLLLVRTTLAWLRVIEEHWSLERLAWKYPPFAKQFGRSCCPVSSHDRDRAMWCHKQSVSYENVIRADESKETMTEHKLDHIGTIVFSTDSDFNDSHIDLRATSQTRMEDNGKTKPFHERKRRTSSWSERRNRRAWATDPERRSGSAESLIVRLTSSLDCWTALEMTGWHRQKYSTNFSLDISSPLIRMRSRASIRCGELNIALSLSLLMDSEPLLLPEESCSISVLAKHRFDQGTRRSFAFGPGHMNDIQSIELIQLEGDNDDQLLQRGLKRKFSSRRPKYHTEEQHLMCSHLQRSGLSFYCSFTWTFNNDR